jgi:phosphoglycerate dehydrogenase-like enzyme
LLDVHDPEPFDACYPLVNLPNATLTPHMAAATSIAHARMSEVVYDVWRVLNGESPRWEA